jgi:hypothetical protein
MDPNDDLTQAERNALDEARKLLGDNLTTFLLSGLSEPTIEHRRVFTARSSPSHGPKLTYQLEIINDSPQGLPIGRDPLVLAALLDLLWERQPLDSTILVRHSDIMEKLQWPQEAESQSLINGALERYLLTAYCLIDPTFAEEEPLCGRYNSIRRLLIGYETTSILHPVKRTEQPRLTRVQFWPALRHDVISERKYFLGLEFQGLKEFRQVP